MTETAGNQSPTKRIAAIDLGTNSFHAVLVDIYPDGSFRTVDKLKEMVILAEKGMENRLSRDAMDRGLEALKRIKFLCENQGVEEILAYATSAIREAENGGDFIQRVLENTGLQVRAIPGTKEAKMIGYAVRHSLSLGEEPVLMADIGGGSVEFIIGNKEEFLHVSSLKLGVARMAAKFVDEDPISEEEIERLREHFRGKLSEVREVLENHPVEILIGSSGTMENIAAMIAHRNAGAPDLTLNEFTFSREEFISFYKDFIKLDKKAREGEKGLDEKRVDIINPGVVLVKFLVEEFGIEKVKISEGALRDGMIIDYIRKEQKTQDWQLLAEFPDPRKRSIYELLHKCNWAKKHSRQVANLALQLYDELKVELDLPESDRELLEFGCLLHDIGYYISYRKHHKHARYLIRNSDLRGFSENEIELMASLARYHRKAKPKKKHKSFRRLDKDLRQRITKLSGILRVADGLDRSHYQNVRNLRIENSADKISLYLTTEGDPELEIWGAEHKADLFEKVTGKKLKVFSKE